MEDLEWDLEYDEIRFYRHLAIKKMEQSKPVKTTQPTSSSSWYGWITGGETKEEKEWDKQLQALYEQFEFQDNDSNSRIYPPDYVKYKLNINLQCGSIRLRSHDNGTTRDLVVSVCDELRILYSGYSSGFSAIFRMKDLNLQNCEDIQFPTLIESQASENEKLDFFQLEYSTKVPGSSADHKLKMRMLPLKVIVNPLVISKIVTRFSVSNSGIALHRLQDAARDVYEGMKTTTKAGLIFAIEEHRTFDLDIEVSAPIFVVPSSAKLKNSPFLVVDAGHLIVRSQLVPKSDTEKLFQKTVSELRIEVYDKFLFNLNAASVFITDTLDFQTVDSDYLVENINLSVVLDVCILMNNSEFTKFKVFADLPRLHLNLGESNLKIAQGVVNFLIESATSPSPSNEMEMGFDFAQNFSERDGDELSRMLEESDQELFHTIVQNSLDTQQLFGIELKIDLLSILISEKNKELALIQASGMSMTGHLTSAETKVDAVLTSLEIANKLEPVGYFPNLFTPETKSESVSLLTYSYSSAVTNNICRANSMIKLEPLEIILVQDCVAQLLPLLRSFAATSEYSGSTDSVDGGSPKHIKSRQSSRKSFSIKSIKMKLVENNVVIGTCRLDTLSLAAEYVDSNPKWTGSVGNLIIIDETDPSKSCVLSIKEDKSVDFIFETLPEQQSRYPTFNSYFSLNSASWNIKYDHRFVSRIQTFFDRIQDFQILVDNASKAAQDSSIQFQQAAGKTYFEIYLESPIVKLPSGTGEDVMVLYPGSVSAATSLDDAGPFVLNRLVIQIISMKLESISINRTGSSAKWVMVENINLKIKADSLNYSKSMPHRSLYADVSDVKIKVTNHQYRLFFQILDSFSNSPSPNYIGTMSAEETSQRSHSEFAVSLPKIVFDAYITPSKFDDPQNYSLAKFVGTGGFARLRLKDSEPLKFELKFGGLSVVDTRQNKPSLFRDILLPINQEGYDQFLLKYESYQELKEYCVSIDRAKVILEMDHLLAIKAFATSASSNDTAASAPESQLKGSVNFVDPEIILVANPNDGTTEAVILKSLQFVVTQDIVVALSFKTLGAFFCRMDQRNESQYRFLDDCDLALQLDDRYRPDGTHTYHVNLELSRIVFRVSYRDIILLKDLSSRVISSTTGNPNDQVGVQFPLNSKSSQKFKVSVEGLKAVLIDDLNDLHLPIFEFGCTKTVFELSDWSSKFQAELGVTLFANYFNIKNSHWEPLIELWQFSIDVRKI